MEQVIEIYKILLSLNLVHTEENFSQKYCMRHKKWLKDSKYHGFTPTLQVLLNIRTMIQALLRVCASHTTDPYMAKIASDLQLCLTLILQAIDHHHGDTKAKLTEVIKHEQNNIDKLLPHCARHPR
jgi:hypothetical protein